MVDNSGAERIQKLTTAAEHGDGCGVMQGLGHEPLVQQLADLRAMVAQNQSNREQNPLLPKLILDSAESQRAEWGHGESATTLDVQFGLYAAINPGGDANKSKSPDLTPDMLRGSGDPGHSNSGILEEQCAEVMQFVHGSLNGVPQVILNSYSIRPTRGD